MQPIKLQTTVPIVLGLLLSFSAKANATDFNLGVADNYNLFATSGTVDISSGGGDVTQTDSDIQGAVAAAGNITLTNFSVGALLPSNYSGPALVAGGNLTLDSGYVNGTAYYGGSSSSNSITAVGSPPGNTSLTPTQGSLINFANADSYLQTLSTSYASETTNGTTSAPGNGTITLTGHSNTGIDVFTVTTEQLASATDLVINADPNATVIINVTGTSATLGIGNGPGGTNAGIGIQINNTSEQNVLYNFYQATSLQAQGVGILGTVLAPQAAFTFNNGQADGNVVVASFDGTGQINDPALTTPEPGTLVGLGSVALLSSFCLRRKAKKV